MNEAEQRRPVVEWEPIQCPECGSTRRRDISRKSGNRKSTHVCRDCSQVYFAIRRPLAITPSRDNMDAQSGD